MPGGDRRISEPSIVSWDPSERLVHPQVWANPRAPQPGFFQEMEAGLKFFGLIEGIHWCGKYPPGN